MHQPRIARPIDTESFRILRSRVNTERLLPCTRTVTERVIHTSADVEYAHDLVCDEAVLHAGWQALHAGWQALHAGWQALHSGAPLRPALVVGMPVGFVDAAAAKAALRASGLPAVSNRSATGGTAAVNAQVYLEQPA